VLIKWITCEVPHKRKRAFDAAQRRWSALGGVPGFIAQIGGWDTRGLCDGADRACIIALWQDAGAYAQFMDRFHDPIAAASAQGDTYTDSGVCVFEHLLDMPGLYASLGEAISPRPELLRVADCTLRPGRDEQFIKTQGMVWLPGMAGVEGMLGGAVGRAIDEDGRYLVATLWRRESDHDRYAESVLLGLKEQAGPDRDVACLAGHAVRLEPDWFVEAV